MKVLFFAQSREAAGCHQYTLKIDAPISTSEFWTLLVKAHPKLEALKKSARLARDETYLQENDLLRPADEIAVIPPVSGG